MNKIYYVDVDDTLVMYFGSKLIPMTRMMAHVRKLHSEGCILYLWSCGGAEYARTVAEDLGLSDCFAGYLPKPNIVIDDKPTWTVLHPNEAMSQD